MKQETDISNLRLATLNDIDLILDLAKRFYNESPYTEIEWNEEKGLEFLEETLTNKDFIWILCEDFGIIGGMKSTYPFSDESYVTELIWYVKPENRNTKVGLNLLKAFEYWAKNVVKVKSIHMMSLLNQRNMEKIYNKFGYNKTEEAYLKWL